MSLVIMEINDQTDFKKNITKEHFVKPTQYEDSPDGKNDSKGPKESLESKKLNIYEALELVGSQHTYQKRFLIFSAFVWLFGAGCILSPVFTYEKPGFNCPPEIKNDDCENWVCSQPDPKKYFSTHPQSFVMFYDPPLICSRQSIADLQIAMNYVGSATGFLVSLYIADNIGRKYATVIFWIIAGVGALISSFFGDSLVISTIGSSIAQFGANSTLNLLFCIMNDHSLGRFRHFSMAAINLFYGLGGTLLVVLIYITPNCRIMMFLIALPILASCLYLFKIYDPPLFLYEKNQEKAVKILNKIAVINKREQIEEDELEKKQVIFKRIYGIQDLLSSSSLKQNAIFSGLVTFFMQISFYGSNLTLSKFGLDTKTNVFATSIADTIGYIATIPLVTRFNRKLISILTGFIFSVIFISFNWIQIPESCILSGICYEKILQAVLLILARFFLAIESGISFIYFTELFPTTVRTIGLGFSSFIGELGSILCSYFVTFLISNGINPLFGLGVVSFCSLAFYFPIEETFNKPQQNEIKELVEVELQKAQQQQQQQSNSLQKC